MKKSNKYLINLLIIFIVLPAFGQGREVIPLNDNWEFYFAYNVLRNIEKAKVTLPHTWNAEEVMAGKIDYYRTAGNYEKKLLIPENYKGKRIFLMFDGANSVATVLINQRFVEEHKGGYTAFCIEITDIIDYGKENLLTVQVNNSANYLVLPLSGDFNVYGGIHRPVSLILTNKDCISPLDFASPGVYIKQKSVSAKSASLEILTKLSLNNNKDLVLKTSVLDKQGKIVSEKSTSLNGNENEIQQEFTLPQPHLWNGRKDPYLYGIKVQLLKGGQPIDEVAQKTGLRFFSVDPDKGFFLNGKPYELFGVCRHEDVKGKGSALTVEDHDRDIEMINAIGATGLRLTHYPHSDYFYDKCDEKGLVLWTEIPLVGPGGYNGAGYIKYSELESHAKQIMQELIRQKFNHPSVCFWGLFNELKLDYDDPVPFLKELNALVKKEDSSRLTTCATFLDNGHFNEVSDLIAWNKYFGWYGGKPEQIGNWADEMHKLFPKKPIGISEYGAGASIKHHTSKLEAPNPSGPFHPEEWQTYYHEKNWEALNKRPYIWGKFIWVFSDFGSSIRKEGDTTGINDKGLVTYDKKVKKDAYYFYKANWNPEPMIHLAEKRHDKRTNELTHVKAYCNLPEGELFLNGKSMGKKKPDAQRIIVWEGVKLMEGLNEIKVRAGAKKSVLEDKATWFLQK